MARWANEYVETVAKARGWRLDRDYNFTATEEDGDGYIDTYMVENLYDAWDGMVTRVNDFIEEFDLDDVNDYEKIVHEFRYMKYKNVNGDNENFVYDNGGQAVYPDFTDFILAKF